MSLKNSEFNAETALESELFFERVHTAPHNFRIGEVDFGVKRQLVTVATSPNPPSEKVEESLVAKTNLEVETGFELGSQFFCDIPVV